MNKRKRSIREKAQSLFSDCLVDATTTVDRMNNFIEPSFFIKEKIIYHIDEI